MVALTRSCALHFFPHAQDTVSQTNNCILYVLFHKGVSIERARNGDVARLNMANRGISSSLQQNVYTSRKFFEAADSTLRGSGVGVVGQLSHKISVVGGEQHVNMVPNRGRAGATLDCIHFCHPGGPDRGGGGGTRKGGCEKCVDRQKGRGWELEKDRRAGRQRWEVAKVLYASKYGRHMPLWAAKSVRVYARRLSAGKYHMA